MTVLVLGNTQNVYKSAKDSEIRQKQIEHN